MINDIRLDGVIRERKSKTMLTGDHSQIEIRCYECGEWVAIKKLENEHIVKKFNCKKCVAAIKRAKKKKKPKKKVAKKPAKAKPKWAPDCPHKAFFRCANARQCQGCYYHTEKKFALMPRYGHAVEEKKTAKIHWFYGDKAHVKKALKLLDDIRLGKGLKSGGNRCYFKHAKKIDDYEY